MTLNVLMVDDDRKGRTSLTEQCAERGDVQIVGEAESGAAALRTTDAPMFPRLKPSGAFQFPQRSHNNLQFLVGERQHRLYPIEVGKIDYIEAQGNYVMIRSGTSDYIRRDSIKRLAAYLADREFMRIARALLLNVRAVAYAEPTNHGTFAFTLSSGDCFQSSTSYRDAILNVLPLVPLSRRKERSSFTRPGKK